MIKNELDNLQIYFEHKNIICTFNGYSPVNFRKYWLSVDCNKDSEKLKTYFACETLEDLRAAVKHVLEETEFLTTTAFVFKSNKGDTFECSQAITFYKDDSESSIESDFIKYLSKYE